ncbi:SDR family NAD(P)-dependent oxidoreductase [Parvularcula sp. ZS-1/3]|uniref:SDR family NAD(P)-dependent oxidoreductase n=1 Tax=Parvularcula mediterranea TaxID=2732508 RepID=A0A7Y3RNL0_9PROT|nr:SDR family NAD(P)-dependent oxidoreductase [Parvularcula mediterranea]NNU17387.1 SDR family NAD(P)-dependent oxidoreductase [Parvularcula mediterranea]
MSISFNDRVAIVTGAGAGLGRSHALALAKRGVKVVVNDLGGSVDGKGASSDAALKVVEEIKAAGGEAIANGASVTDPDAVGAMVEEAMSAFGQVDILVNNAGVLRDKSFSKMTLDDFRFVLDVHLMGSVICTKAVWDHMREREYGRVVMTSSSSGLYGNFGQSNYGAAKMGLVGLMNVLHIEGAKKGVHVNTLAPTAATRMTEGLIPENILALMTPESVTAALLYLACDEAPSRLILAAGAGGYAATRITETDGISLETDHQLPEEILAQMDKILDETGEQLLEDGSGQTMKFVQKAMAREGAS